MNDYIESRLGIKKLLERLKTPEGKKYIYICIAVFIFCGLFFISISLSNYLDWNAVNANLDKIPIGSSIPDNYYPFRPYAQYLGYFSLAGAVITCGIGMWYYKHVWKEPLFADLLIPQKYGRYFWMIIGLACVGIGILFLFLLTLISGGELIYSIIGFIIWVVVGILLFLYGYK